MEMQEKDHLESKKDSWKPASNVAERNISVGFEMGRNRQGLATAWMLGEGLVRTEEASELDQVGLGRAHVC